MDQRIIVLTAKGAVIILRHRQNEFEVEQTLQLNGIPPTTGVYPSYYTLHLYSRIYTYVHPLYMCIQPYIHL